MAIGHGSMMAKLSVVPLTALMSVLTSDGWLVLALMVVASVCSGVSGVHGPESQNCVPLLTSSYNIPIKRWLCASQ